MGKLIELDEDFFKIKQKLEHRGIAPALCEFCNLRGQRVQQVKGGLWACGNCRKLVNMTENQKLKAQVAALTEALKIKNERIRELHMQRAVTPLAEIRSKVEDKTPESERFQY